MNFSNASKMIHHWTQNHAAGVDHKVYGGRVYSYGPKIYSYGSHYLAAQYLTDKNGVECALINSTSYSVTTAGHVSEIRGAIPGYIPTFQAPGAEPSACFNYYLQLIRDAAEKLPRARSNRAGLAASIDNYKHKAADFAARLLQRELTADERAAIATDTDPAESARLIQAAAEATERARIAKATKDKADAVKLDKKRARDWKASKYNGSLYYATETYIRLAASGEYVETTRGARLSLAEARALYLIIVRNEPIAERTFGGWRVAYNTGKLQIGCHVITRKEINRFAVTIGWKI